MKLEVAVLPAGWAATSLGEIRLDRGRSIDPRESPEQRYELYSVPSHADGCPEILLGREIGSTKQTLEPVAVVVCKINPRINRVWVIEDRTPHPKIGSGEWIPFSPVPGVNPHYLAHYMRQGDFRNYLAANVSGVGGSLMRVRPAVIDAYPFRLAPEREQRQLVEAIDSYVSRLDEAEAALGRVQRNLKRYRAAVLQAAVEGRLVPTEAELARAQGRDYEPASELLKRILAERRRRWGEAERARLTAAGKSPEGDKWKLKYEELQPPDRGRLPELPEGWCWMTVGQLATVGTGATPRRGETRYWAKGSIPWVSSGAVNNGLIEAPSALVTDAALRETNLTLYPPGTLLVAMYGEGQTRGRVAELRIESTTNQALAALVLDGESALLRGWLRLFLQENYEELRRSASGGVQPNLNLEIVRSILVPLPPLPEAHRIVREAQAALSVADRLHATVSASAARSARTRQSILKWAFEGRLVDQDPNDEPASVLLERIRAERAQADVDKPRTRRTRARKAR